MTTIAVCEPRYYEVSYRINPWMDPTGWQAARTELAIQAQTQWHELKRSLKRLGANLCEIQPQKGVPDMVFMANSAVVYNGKALLSRFRYPERRREEPFFESFFSKLVDAGSLKDMQKLSDGMVLEGAGDCIWDEARELFWCGFGPRSDRRSATMIEDYFERPTVSLELIDERYYHMDTCLMPLSGGDVIYFPGAFSPADLEEIYVHVPEEKRIAVSEADAQTLAVNGVNLGVHYLTGSCGGHLEAQLAERGYQVHNVDLSAFKKSGGSAFCLTLRLDYGSAGRLE